MHSDPANLTPVYETSRPANEAKWKSKSKGQVKGKGKGSRMSKGTTKGKGRTITIKLESEPCASVARANVVIEGSQLENEMTKRKDSREALRGKNYYSNCCDFARQVGCSTQFMCMFCQNVCLTKGCKSEYFSRQQHNNTSIMQVSIGITIKQNSTFHNAKDHVDKQSHTFLFCL